MLTGGLFLLSSDSVIVLSPRQRTATREAMHPTSSAPRSLTGICSIHIYTQSNRKATVHFSLDITSKEILIALLIEALLNHLLTEWLSK